MVLIDADDLKPTQASRGHLQSEVLGPRRTVVAHVLQACIRFAT